MLVALLPLYRDEDLILCDMPLAKCYDLVHALSIQNGAVTIWADEDTESQEHEVNQARDIIRRNVFRYE